MNIRAKIYGGGVPEPELLGAKKAQGAKADELDSVVVRRQEKRRSNNRQGDRHRLLNEQVRLTHDGNTRDVELINLSGGGAMVSGIKPKLWDKVELHLGTNGTVECSVCWICGGRAGLEFAHETRLDCSADEQARVLRQVIVRSFPDLHFDPPPATEAEPEDEPEDEREDEQRRERRHALIWSAELHHRDTKIRVRVRNISSTGAMIETSEPMLVGGQAILELGEDGFIPATVAWMIGDQVGLAFRSTFDMAQLARSEPEIAPAKWLRPDYLGPGSQQDSPWSKTWARMSPSELRQQLEGFLKH